MILHVMPTEKFTDYAIAQFSALEIKSEFVLIPIDDPLEYVKQRDKTKIVKYKSAEYSNLLTHLGDYTGIILHSAHYYWAEDVLRAVPDYVKVAWMFWGGEIYGRHDIGEHFLAPITSLISRIHTMHKIVEEKKKKDYSWELPIELYQRVDVCLTDEKEEYEYSKCFLRNKMTYMWYNYYTLEEMMGQMYEERCNGNNVIIGNSATDSCNYWDVLLRLKALHIGERKIVLPLSYGAQWISKSVSRYSKILFPKNTMPLLDFMPREEYNKVLLGCNTMIMGHYHPQAQGNIITGLWLGMRVYLSERSMTYHYFRRIGCKVYSIEHDLNRKNPDVFAPMTQEDIDTNRVVLKKFYSKEEMHKRNLEIVKALS